MDGTREIMSEAQSLAIREDTMRAMKHNVTVRDPESGHCYKNGGVAPYPWETYYRYLGVKNRNGYEIRKALWRLVPEYAAVIRWMVVTLKIELRLSNTEIRDELNGIGSVDRPEGLPLRPMPIPSPRAGPGPCRRSTTISVRTGSFSSPALAGGTVTIPSRWAGNTKIGVNGSGPFQTLIPRLLRRRRPEVRGP